MEIFPDTELERQYVNTTTTIIIVLAVFAIILIAISITLLVLYLKNRKRLPYSELNIVKNSNIDLSENEIQIVSEYRKLDKSGKLLIQNTLDTLNSKSSDK